MKILIVHNRYLKPGGEDSVVESERQMLLKNGHEVFLYQRSNKELISKSFICRLKTIFIDVFFSKKTYSEVAKICNEFKPDIAHVHNTFFMVSPSVYLACKKNNVPVVQTLHNFRLICPNALLLRNRKQCHKCIDGAIFNAVIWRCWRGSFFQTFMVVAYLIYHRLRATFIKEVDAYIALNSFSESLFKRTCLAKKKFYVKPNFVEEVSRKRSKTGEYILYAGALSDYKGIDFLIALAEELKGIRFKVIGDGDEFYTAKLKELPNVEFLGRKNNAEVVEYMKDSRFLLVPSLCYENFPRVLAEAFSCGVPAAVSDFGSFAEIVEDNMTGILFSPFNQKEAFTKIESFYNDISKVDQCGNNAYNTFLDKYCESKNYAILVNTYNDILISKRLKS